MKPVDLIIPRARNGDIGGLGETVHPALGFAHLLGVGAELPDAREVEDVAILVLLGSQGDAGRVCLGYFLSLDIYAQHGCQKKN